MSDEPTTANRSITASSDGGGSTQPLNPRRSASGGFIGPADDLATTTGAISVGGGGTSSASGTSSLAKPPGEDQHHRAPGPFLTGASAGGASSVPGVAVAAPTNTVTNFALISGPIQWPKDLLRQDAQHQAGDNTMSWTKVISYSCLP